MAIIKVLPEFVINRIAAGEVVERPASVVKELVENSLDANAGRIEVELEMGGCRLVKVSDNGMGMAPEDLELAWLRHATSKLSNPEELISIRTLGFRGEALPSIGSVSQATMTSRVKGASEGARITISGGALGKVAAVGAPEGTTVEVRNLFFNTPVRKKFMRTPKTEEAHAVEAFTRLAIPCPTVGFRLWCDGKQTFQLPGGVELIERIRGLFGDDMMKQLTPVNFESGALRVSGYAGRPSAQRSNSQMMYAFINGRYIRDRLVMRAISEAYRGLLPSGRFPVVFLVLDMEPSRIDVNVHPSKIEVRFREPDALFQQVLKALSLASSAWRQGSAPVQAPVLATPEPAKDARRAEIKQAISDFFQSRPGPRTITEHAVPAASAPPSPALHGKFCQFRSSYIVEETADGINIIDQHALHERILYESLSSAAKGRILSQRLLVPEVIELKPRDLRLVLEMRDALGRMGIEVEEFGGNSVAVRALPQMLDGTAPAALLLDMLDQLRGEAAATSREEQLRRLIACKAAVKAGQPLTTDQIDALLRRRDELHIQPSCPHGRPTTVHISDDEMARKFQRK